MTEFEVATYLECPEPELVSKLRLFASILEDLGVSPMLTADWLASISWEDDGSGFGCMGDPLQLNRIRLNGDVVTARPHLLGYTDLALPGTPVPWVQLSLFFEGEWEIPHVAGSEVRWRYIAGIGRLIWRVIQAYSVRMPDSAVFFNDYASVNEPWYALLGVGGNLWDFDVASVPGSLARIFQPVPDNYAQMAGQNRIGFARMAYWQIAPWGE